MTTRPVGRPFVATLILAAGVVAATRWPFRSHALFSWDSANFALAMARIDIAAHRPHPPGYLGYVLAARALDLVVHDPNTSLVLWNMLATALAAAVLIRWAWELTDGQTDQRLTSTAAAAVFLTGPLLWFYGEVAEIYASELLVVLVVAFFAWRTIRGGRRDILWCVAALALAAVFKLTAAILIGPLALYAWTRAPSTARRQAAILALVLAAAVGAGFLALQPNLPSIVWTHFTNSTGASRLIGGTASATHALNANARDTFTATLCGLGVVNAVALVVWLAIDRRLPAGLGRLVAGLWLAPWLVLVLAVHIGKQAYILPIVPLAILVLASFYARLGGGLATGLVALQVVANVAQFVWLTPPLTGRGVERYRDKTMIERIASDLEAVAFPTATTIARSDRRAAALVALVDQTCPSRDPIIVGEEDWRRALWYFPQAITVNTSGSHVLFSARETDATGIPESGVSFTTRCPVIWLAGDDGRPTALTPRDSTAEPGVGALTAPGRYAITPIAIARTTGAQR